MAASNDMILDRGLDAEEKAKFARLKDRLSSIFMAAGYPIRLCEGMGEAEHRQIRFVPGLTGSPLVSVPAAQFLALSDEEFLHRLTSLIQWLKVLSVLVDSVEKWAGELGWATRRVPKELTDLRIGSYAASALLLQERTVRVLLEPVGRGAPNAEGVVDLYLLPAYDDIASLYYYDNRWNVHYMAAGAPIVGNIREAASKPLSKGTLRKVLESMKQHVA